VAMKKIKTANVDWSRVLGEDHMDAVGALDANMGARFSSLLPTSTKPGRESLDPRVVPWRW
jgi:hypothetical protein